LLLLLVSWFFKGWLIGACSESRVAEGRGVTTVTPKECDQRTEGLRVKGDRKRKEILKLFHCKRMHNILFIKEILNVTYLCSWSHTPLYIYSPSIGVGKGLLQFNKLRNPKVMDNPRKPGNKHPTKKNLPTRLSAHKIHIDLKRQCSQRCFCNHRMLL
jgi:hypothetical protein